MDSIHYHLSNDAKFMHYCGKGLHKWRRLENTDKFKFTSKHCPILNQHILKASLLWLSEAISRQCMSSTPTLSMLRDLRHQDSKQFICQSNPIPLSNGLRSGLQITMIRVCDFAFQPMCLQVLHVPVVFPLSKYDEEGSTNNFRYILGLYHTCSHYYGQQLQNVEEHLGIGFFVIPIAINIAFLY